MWIFVVFYVTHGYRIFTAGLKVLIAMEDYVSNVILLGLLQSLLEKTNSRLENTNYNFSSIEYSFKTRR